MTSGPAILRRALTVLLAVAAASLALPAPAAAATLTEGALAEPFSFTAVPDALEIIGGTDQAVRLRTTASLVLGPASPFLQTYPGGDATPDPRSVDVLANGDLLIADRERCVIAEITSGGVPVWTYSYEDDPALVRPFSAQRFVAGGRELTLIADRWAARVFAVDESKQVVWQYGKTDLPGLGVDEVTDPFFAQYREGRVLIADNNGGNRVLEVRYDDYQADAPDHGFDSESIVWQYGTSAVYGSTPGLLKKPRSPQRLDNGNVLICDADGQRVIEVRASDYDADAPLHGFTAASIVWQFGVTDQAGSDDGHLFDPTYAERLSGGTTLIADTNNGRVLEVSRQGAILRRWDLVTLGRPATATATDVAEPRAATLRADGSLVTADTAFGQILDIGVAARATAVSEALDGGRPSTVKRWSRISIDADLPTSTGLELEYSVDATAWRTAALSDDLVATLPDDAVGAALAYRLALGTSALRITPVVESVTLEYGAVTVTDEVDSTTPTPAPVTAVPYDSSGLPATTAVVATGSGTGSGTGTGGGSGSASTAGSGDFTGGALAAGEPAADGSAAVSGYPLAAAGGALSGVGAIVEKSPAGGIQWPPLAGLALAAAVAALIVRRAEREHRRLMTLDYTSVVEAVADTPSQPSPRQEATA